MPHLIAQIFEATAGLIYAMLALTTWTLLHAARDKTAVRLWSLGAGAMGLGFAMLALRDVVGGWTVFFACNVLLILSLCLRVLALRRHLGWPPHAARAAGVVVLLSVAYGLTLLSPDYRWRAGISTLWLATGTGVLAWHAAATGQATNSRNARVLAWVEWLLAASLLLRGITAGLGWTTSAQVDKPAWDWFLLLGLAILAACYGNVGYVGLVLDDAQAAELRARQAQLAETLKREAAEQQASALHKLLDQRDRLADDRARLLHLLDHGVRQPLHTASGALQAAEAVLQQPQANQLGQAIDRLDRAQGVLGNVQSALDNTLVAANLLARRGPLLLVETEIDFLITLVLGDLPAAQRAAVQVQTLNGLRSAELEPGLVRLALRNLLRNAFAHGGLGVQVQLRIAEQDSPPALTLSVLDNGVGLVPAQLLAARLRVVADAPLPARGLGLHLAGRVATLHGGHLLLADHPPHGLHASLVLPLPLLPASAPA